VDRSLASLLSRCCLHHRYHQHDNGNRWMHRHPPLIQEASLGKEKTSPSPGRSSLGLSHLTPKPLKPPFLPRSPSPLQQFPPLRPARRHPHTLVLKPRLPAVACVPRTFHSLSISRFHPLSCTLFLADRVSAFASFLVNPSSPSPSAAGPLTRTSLQSRRTV